MDASASASHKETKAAFCVASATSQIIVAGLAHDKVAHVAHVDIRIAHVETRLATWSFRGRCFRV